MQQHGDRFRWRVLRWWLAEEGPASSHRASPRAIREQAEVANTHEATRHDVQQKTSQEFVGVECHDLHAIMIRIILPAEPDVTVTVIDQPIIRQGDTVGVATEIAE